MRDLVYAAAATAQETETTTGWKWAAVGIGLGLLAIVYAVSSLATGSWNPWKLVEGADGRPSTSKLQWFLWIVVILFAYTALWVIRASQGDYTAIKEVPTNVLTILGFSTGTAAAAKGITGAYVANNKVAKPAPAAAGNGGGGNSGGVLSDDNGAPELAKIQMIGFTLIAIGIFLANVFHQIASKAAPVSIPDVDSSLLVLMGISQGGYLGKKLVTFGSPTLYPLTTPNAAPNASVTVKGVNLGAAAAGSDLTIDGTPIGFTTWSDTAIQFTVPAMDPVNNLAWAQQKVVNIGVDVGGQASNTVPLSVN